MKRKILILITIIISLLFTGCTDALLFNSSKNQVEAYFTKEGESPDKALISLINSSKKNLDIAIYSITKSDIVNSVVNAKKRGVSIRIITDNAEAKSKYEIQELDYIKNARIPVKVNTHKGLMHIKMTIKDANVAAVGSYNYTNDATYYNDELFVVINNKNALNKLEEHFNKMWNSNKYFENL